MLCNKLNCFCRRLNSQSCRPQDPDACRKQVLSAFDNVGTKVHRNACLQSNIDSAAKGCGVGGTNIYICGCGSVGGAGCGCGCLGGSSNCRPCPPCGGVGGSSNCRPCPPCGGVGGSSNCRPCPPCGGVGGSTNCRPCRPCGGVGGAGAGGNIYICCGGCGCGNNDDGNGGDSVARPILSGSLTNKAGRCICHCEALDFNQVTNPLGGPVSFSGGKFTFTAPGRYVICWRVRTGGGAYSQAFELCGPQSQGFDIGATDGPEGSLSGGTCALVTVCATPLSLSLINKSCEKVCLTGGSEQASFQVYRLC